MKHISICGAGFFWNRIALEHASRRGIRGVIYARGENENVMPAKLTAEKCVREEGGITRNYQK